MMKQHGSEPATRHFTIVTSNTDPVSPTPRFLYAASNGNIVITDDANTTVTYTVTTGTVLPFRAFLVRTDSTANVVAWY